jgi:hypothetical protein
MFYFILISTLSPTMNIPPGSTLVCHTYQSYTISAFHSIWPPTHLLVINAYLHLHSWHSCCGTKVPASLTQYVSVPSPLAHHSVFDHLHHPNLYMRYPSVLFDYSSRTTWHKMYGHDTLIHHHLFTQHHLIAHDTWIFWNFKCVLIHSAAVSCFSGNNQ